MSAIDPLERVASLYARLRSSRHPVSRSRIFVDVPGYGEGGPASLRLFERDKDLLRGLGVEISVVKMEEGASNADLGYFIPETTLLPDPGLTDDEAAALALAATTIRMNDERITSALLKMTAGPGGPAPAPSAVAVVSTDPRLPVIHDAVTRRCRVSFTYKGEKRTIEPSRVARANKGRWYLTGFDLLRQAERVFRLDQVEGEIDKASEPGAFEPPSVLPSGTPLPAWMYGPDFEDVTLRVDAEAAEWAVREAGVNVTVERLDDGSVVLTVPVANPEAFRGFAISLLDHAEILSPASLREDLRAWVQAFVGEN